MGKEKIYSVDFTEHEIYSLKECLSELRKWIDRDFQNTHPTQAVEPIKQPVFVAASELQFKLAKVINPNTKVTLQDYLEYGKYDKRD